MFAKYPQIFALLSCECKVQFDQDNQTGNNRHPFFHLGLQFALLTNPRKKKSTLFLDKNFEEYSKYFLWKTKFRVKINNHNLAICKLCEALNDPQKPVKVYSNMEEWWREEAKCKSKGQFPWSRKDSPFSLSA